MGLKKIIIRGARQHNLKNISLEIPRNTLTVITGLSGSGKSSLAFDTLYAEGQRSYVESLSAYARQFLDQMERPDVDSVEGLSPSIAIEQKTTTRSPRSTVGTITEIYDYLRVVYSAIGAPHCPKCGKPITRQSTEQIVQAVTALKPEDRIMVLAPVVRGRKGEYKKELEKYAKEGYVRARVDGELVNLDEPQPLDRRKNHTIEIVVDRLLLKNGIAQRLEQSIETALKLTGGLVTIAVVGGEEHVYSEKLACSDCGISVPQLEPRSFSFNSPYGACPECHGLGSKYDFDPAKVIVDWTKPLFEGGLGPGSGSACAAAHLEDCGGGLRIRSRDAVRQTLAQGAEPDSARESGERRLEQRPEFPGSPGASGEQPRRIEFRYLPRVADAVHVARPLHGLRRAAPAPGKPCGENRRAIDRGLHVAAADGGAPRGGQDSRTAHAAATQNRRAPAGRNRRTDRFPAGRRPGLSDARPLRGDAFGRRSAANSARDTDRLTSARRALRARRTIDRIARPRQRPAAEHARDAARSRQHGPRRRARRRDDSPRQLRGGPWPRRRQRRQDTWWLRARRTKSPRIPLRSPVNIFPDR